ncbi:hypothetical protein GCM10028807_36350 [Spirosoma daeguense]
MSYLKRWWFFRRISSIFSINNGREEKKLTLREYFELILSQSKVDNVNLRFYEEGKKLGRLLSKNKAKEFSEEYIKTTFEVITFKLRLYNTEILNSLNENIHKLGIEIKQKLENLDESNESGLIGKYNILIKEAIKNEKDFHDNAFADWQIIRPQKIISRYIQNLETLLQGMESKKDGFDLINSFSDQIIIKKINERVLFVNAEFSKHLPDNNSTYYPPMKYLIIFFYTLCGLITYGEIGISLTVSKGFIDLVEVLPTGLPPQDKENMNIFFSILFSLAFSLSIAVLLKVMIDKLLFSPIIRLRRLFWMGYAFLVIIYLIYYYKVSPDDILTIISISVIFSIFAFSNALLFREASYLNTVYYQIHKKPLINFNILKFITLGLWPREQLISKKLVKKKEKIIKTQTALLNRLKQTKLEYEYQLSTANRQYTTISSSIVAYEGLALSKFWQGYQESLLDNIASDDDLNYIIKKSIFDQNL